MSIKDGDDWLSLLALPHMLFNTCSMSEPPIAVCILLMDTMLFLLFLIFQV